MIGISGPKTVHKTYSVTFFFFFLLPSAKKRRKWEKKIIKLGKREIWFKWMMGGGDTTMQRSNKQGSDQGDRESKAETMGFYGFSKHMVKFSAPKGPKV